MATRCCSPPESVSVRCQARAEQPHVGEGAPRHRPVRGGEPARQRRPAAPAPHVRQAADEDVVHHLQAANEVELLEDHADPGPVRAQRAGPPRSARSSLAEPDAPLRHHGGPREAAQQRGLPRARPADHRHELAGVDGHRHADRARGVSPKRLLTFVELHHGRDRVDASRAPPYRRGVSRPRRHA